MRRRRRTGRPRPPGGRWRSCPRRPPRRRPFRVAPGGSRQPRPRPVEWKDVITQFLAIADPAQALADYGSGLTPEDGDSRAHACHWITSLDTYGTPDTSVTANVPTHAVLSKNGARTYVAYNAGTAVTTVTFSDGQTLSVPASSTAWRGPAGSGVDSGSGGVDPTTTTSTTTTTTTPPSRDAFGTIQAESYDQHKGVFKETTTDTGGGQNIAGIANGEWTFYRGVDFGTRTGRQFVARVASGAAGGVSGLVEVRIGSPTAAPVGGFAVADTGGWQSWRTVPANITGLTGRHDVYLTFTSGQPADFVNVNWIQFGS